MASFFSFLTTRRFPTRARMSTFFEGPLTWARFFFYILSGLVLITAYILILQINKQFLVTVPAMGGSINEGVIGSPRFLSPIFATTDTDKALSKLVYAGLMRETVDGKFVPELAKDYIISPDGTSYTFTLKDKLTFQDKKPLTPEDILFTVGKLQDSTLNAQNAAYWQNVSAEVVNANTVAFHLPAPDKDFLSRLAFGILPQHVLENVPTEQLSSEKYSLHPVGAGPYKLESYTESNGIVTSLQFKKNKFYAGIKPYIKELNIKVYGNQDSLLSALLNGNIDMTSALEPDTLAKHPLPKDFSVAKTPISKTVALYRSQNETTLSDPAFVNILDAFIDKNDILAKVDNGYGTPSTIQADEEAKNNDTLASLNSLGYTYTNGTLMHRGSPVGFAISVSNDPKSLLTAQLLATKLGELGMLVSIKAFDQGNFQDEITSGRSNVVLVRDETTALPVSYRPALTLYEQSLPYVIDSRVSGIAPDVLINPTLRYENIENWYTNTDSVWKFLVRNSNR